MAIDFTAISAASATPTTSATSSSTSSSSSSSAADPSVGSQDYFLKLLVAQMNNQDPLNPMDSAQMTSQLAQLNTVQGIQKLSTQLDSLLSDVGSSQSLQASSLVGKDVLVPGTSLDLENGQAVGGLNLAGDADTVTISIKDSTGTVIHTAQLGQQNAGLVNFVWDGSTDAGTTAAAGSYTFSATAKSGTSTVVADTMSTGIVSSVTPSASGASIFVNGVGMVALSQVKQIY
jgi:flagellar basal-body rod modification protein FlgD